MLKAGNIRSKDINEFINSKLRSRLTTLPASATEILIFRTDFPRTGVATRLASRQPRVSESECRDQSSLRKAGLTWTLRNEVELLQPAFTSRSGAGPVFLQVRDVITKADLHLIFLGITT